MSDKFTPDTQYVRNAYVDHRYNLAADRGEYPPGIVERMNEFGRWLADRDARIRAEEREHVNQQIQNRLYDFEPEDREDGYLLNPATVTIRASDLNDIISGGDSDVRFSFTDEELEKHTATIEAIVGKLRAARELREAVKQDRMYNGISYFVPEEALLSRADRLDAESDG